MSGIFHTLLGVDVCYKLKIQADVASDSTSVGIRCMYKAVNKNKVICSYIEALEFQTGVSPVHWEDNTIFIYVFEAKMVARIVKTH